MFGVTLQISGLVKRAPLTPGRAAHDGLVVVIAALAVGRFGWVRCRTARPGREAGSDGPARSPPSTAGSPGSASSWWRTTRCCRPSSGSGTTRRVALYALFLLVLGVADFVEAAALEARRIGPWRGRSLRWWQSCSHRCCSRSCSRPGPSSTPISDRSRRRTGTPASGSTRTCPSDAVLASWDAGVVGYYARRPVINLDGVANSKEYYDAGHDGTVGAFLVGPGPDRHRQPRDPGRRARPGDRRVHPADLWGPETAGRRRR